jgi:hypothetical protein
MSDRELRNELKHPAYEPLLPVEKKLIGWSLGVLILVNHFYPLNV